MFEMLGAVYNKDNLLDIVHRILKDCKQNVDYDKLKEVFTEFMYGNLDENHFWKRLEIDNHMMPRKLILEEIENALDKEFLDILPLFSGNRIVLKGNLPQEWGEFILESTTVSNLIHSYIFSGSLGKDVNDEEFLNLLKDRLGENILFIETDLDNYEKIKRAGFQPIFLLRKPIHVGSVKPDVVISRLKQLEDLLGEGV